MYGYIYKTTNLINGKFYIGQKKSSFFLGESYLGSGVRLKSAIKHYGKENFVVEVIDFADSRDELNEKEIFWISKLDATNLDIAYNVSQGGDGGNTGSMYKGMLPTHQQTAEERQKRSESLKRAYKEGRHMVHLSDEARKKMSDKAKQRHPKPTTSGRKWVTDGVKNVFAKQEDIQSLLEKGFTFGRVIQNEVWNKGLTKDTDERVKKYSDTRKALFKERGQIGCYGKEK